MTAASISGENADRPSTGQPLRTIWRVMLVRIVFSNCSLIQPEMCAVVLHVHRAGEVEDQLGGVSHLHRVLAEDAQGDDQPGLRIFHFVDAATEAVPRVLASTAEEQLGAVGVAARADVDEHAEERQLVGLDHVTTGPERADHLATTHEHGHHVGLDDGSGALAQVVVGPLEDDLVLVVVGDRNELT